MARLRWIIAGIENHFGWPTVSQSIKYLGDRFLLRPETDKQYPSVCLDNIEALSLEEGQYRINRFLSALSWSEGYGAKVTMFTGNSSKSPINVGKGSLRMVSEPWNHVYLPIPANDSVALALALFREAMTLNTEPFQFLGYFKILNINYGKGQDQIDWINNNISMLDEEAATTRVTELMRTVSDIGEYLYAQGRCAVAHANTTDVVNPDSVEDWNRLKDDLPVVKNLAKHLISTEFGVMTNLQFYESIRHVTKPEDLPAEYVNPEIQ